MGHVITTDPTIQPIKQSHVRPNTCHSDSGDDGHILL